MNLFLPNNIIGIGWEEMGDIKYAGDNRDDIKKSMRNISRYFFRLNSYLCRNAL